MNALTELHRDLVEIFGYGVQVSVALLRWNQWLNQQVAREGTTLDNEMFFGEGDPNNPESTYHYRRTFRHLLDVSSPNGHTNAVHRRNLISLLYTSWEDRHRHTIAKEAGLKHKNDLRSDVFGDVRLYRNAIVHANGRLDEEPRVLCFFRRGDTIALTSDHIDLIFRTSIEELNRLGREYFGVNPGFTFEEPMHV